MDVSDTLRLALADRYTIERELGQGGMATVYLAEDLRHHRKVALKVLRPEIAATLGAGRFAREIEVAARLQHPNILPLLDSGEAEGFFFYVMPYVEGESLRNRLARGGELPIHDAVRILMEVADALSHAHAHGVVHRDIKPDNVMLSGRHALVADFGVAKAVTEATGRQVLTSAGVALGTPAYMAPEQAVADPHQDHRVDIYALGVLGYELLTGRAPFSATTAQEMLAAHVTAEPEPLEQHRPTVSPALAAVVMKCLAKKPADRWQTADELLTALEPLATPSGGTTPTQARPVGALGRWPRWAKWGAGAAAVAVVALAVSQVVKSRPLNISVSDNRSVTSEPGVEFLPAISPDGNEVAYVAGPIGLPRLSVRTTASVAGGAAVRLGDTALGSEWLPTWSPDGQFVRFLGCPGSVGFNTPSCALRETGKLGGAVRTVMLPLGATQPSWSPDGARMAFIRADTIFTATAAGADARRVAIHTAQYWGLNSLVWSPDRKWIAYVNGNSIGRTTYNPVNSSIWIVNAGGGEPRRVTTDNCWNASPAWLDARHILFVSNRDGPRGAYVVEVGPDGGRGDPRAIPGIVDPHSISYSITGRRLAYSRFSVRANIWAYPLGRSAPISIRDGRPVTTGDQEVGELDVSQDGKWIVYEYLSRGNSNTYKAPSAGGEAVQLTDSPWNKWRPRWSPDGREIAFMEGVRFAAEGVRLSDMPAEGGPPVVLASTSRGWNHYPAWSPDGLRIAFRSTRTGQGRLFIVSRDSVGGPWHEAVQLTDFACGAPSDWAPDGSGVLCTSGRDLVLVSPQGKVVWRRDLAATSGLSNEGWWDARYSRDGRTVFALAVHKDGRRGIWAIPVAGGAPRLVISHDDPSLQNQLEDMSVGPDRMYLIVSRYESDIWVANLHW